MNATKHTPGPLWVESIPVGDEQEAVTTTANSMNEALEKVIHDLGFAGEGLREALHNASAVEGRVILPLIKAVYEVRAEVQALCAARRDDAANTGYPADSMVQDAIEALDNLTLGLSESHMDEMKNGHGGDAEPCSYCDAIRLGERAKAQLEGHQIMRAQ